MCVADCRASLLAPINSVWGRRRYNLKSDFQMPPICFPEPWVPPWCFHVPPDGARCPQLAPDVYVYVYIYHILFYIIPSDITGTSPNTRLWGWGVGSLRWGTRGPKPFMKFRRGSRGKGETAPPRKFRGGAMPWVPVGGGVWGEWVGGISHIVVYYVIFI